MGSVGAAYDNALCESFFATLECELLDRERFRTPGDARRAVFDSIEGWYNPRRRHSALGYESPLHYERLHAVTTQEVMVGGKPRAVQPRGSTIAQGGYLGIAPWGKPHLQQMKAPEINHEPYGVHLHGGHLSYSSSTKPGQLQ
jgi:putative transposase